MELKDTAKGMESSDFKDRFIAEYQQLVLRMHKIDLALENNKNSDALEPIDVALLKEQYGYMSQYEDVLYQRANDRLNIKLPTWDEIIN